MSEDATPNEPAMPGALTRSAAGFVVALQLMTRLPTPRLKGHLATDLGAAAPWTPVAGLIIGALLMVAMSIGALHGPSIAALFTLLMWVIVTGAMHLEGLADTADGLGAAHGDPNRFLEVARDPRTGSFGATAIALMLITKLVLLAEVADAGRLLALALVPAWARWVSLALARLVAPLGNGLGRRFASGATLPIIAIEAAALAGMSFWTAPELLVAMPAALLFAFYWQRRLGGMSGDCHGATIEMMEAILICLLALRPLV